MSAPTPRTTNTFSAAATLCRRELVRFYRQKSRIVGVVGSPLVFWFLIGSGLGKSFRNPSAPPSMSYLEYFFPGTIVLIILFTAIFSTISIIEDRREGFLQSVLVAPVSNGSIALGKILGGTVLSVAQSIILLCLAPFIGISFTVWSLVLILLTLFVVSFGLTGLGFLIAWRMDSSQGFHAIMNLFLIPLWLLSGALFPASGAAGWIGAIMQLNPITYGVSVLRQLLYLGSDVQLHELASIPVCMVISIAFAAASYFACSFSIKR
jgi:ABC-2 type transport system permease protein